MAKLLSTVRKLDFMVKDALGRQWQLGTIQVDYNLPERFDLTYKGSDNELHRTSNDSPSTIWINGTFYRDFIEHTAGNFPLWLMPEQAIILSLSEKYENYAKKVLELLENHEIRALIDNRNETIGKKIREAESAEIPVYADCWRGRREKRNHFCTSSWTGRKRKYYR